VKPPPGTRVIDYQGLKGTIIDEPPTVMDGFPAFPPEELVVIRFDHEKHGYGTAYPNHDHLNPVVTLHESLFAQDRDSGVTIRPLTAVEAIIDAGEHP
jgi:hypothetical protein